MEYITREASLEDMPIITKIYNEGIEDRVATLETRLRTDDEMKHWLLKRSNRHKVVVILDENNIVLGWASLNAFSTRACYNGVADISIYIKRNMRGKGIGRKLLSYLIAVAKEQGFHKIVLGMLAFNTAAKKLYLSLGFRVIGTYINQGVLDGEWVDVTLMEKLII